MQKVFIGICIVVLILAPIFFLVLRNPFISTYIQRLLHIPIKNQVSEQYAVTNNAPNISMKIVDTAYLDFIAANMGIFKELGVVDPKVYREKKDSTQKYTVRHVRFVLVNDLDTYLYAASGERAFASKGNYQIIDDTVEIQVSLNVKEITKGAVNTHYALEEAFLTTTFTTLLYAHGLSTPRETVEALTKIKSDMKQYLETGIFNWPIQIIEQ